jgi:outer membrane biosynthesis protein TonB
MVEALTQRAPPRPDARSEAISLPAALPPAFADAVRRCLSRNPDERPTIADLQSQTEPVPQAAAMPASQAAEVRDSQDRAMPVPQAPATPVPEAATSGREAATPVPGAVATPVPPPATRETWEATALRRLPKRVPLVPAAMAGFTVLLVVWGGSRLLHKHPGSAQPPSAVAETSTPPAAPPPEPEQSPKASMSAPSAVIHREIPEVSRGARASIRGHIKVTVRVTVDRSGNVIRQTLQNPGSSKYFARLASAAAGKWKFGPSDDQALRVWLLSFEFARGGATGLAAEQR